MSVFSSVQTGGGAVGDDTLTTSTTQTTATDGDLLDTATASGSSTALAADQTGAVAATGGEGLVILDDGDEAAGVLTASGGIAGGDTASSDTDLWIFGIDTIGADVVVGQTSSTASGTDGYDAWAYAEAFGDQTGGGGTAVDNPDHAFAIDTAVAVDTP
jgi:hypothetical protein